jgi:diguanylate cyclase (GGDEF)-like protein
VAAQESWQDNGYLRYSPPKGGGINGDNTIGIAGVAGAITLIAGVALVAIATGQSLTYVALAVLALAALGIVLLLARRRSTQAAPAEATGPPVHPLLAGDDAILRFTHDVTRPASFDQVQMLIARQLPVLLGVERAWIVARLAGRQRVILPGRDSESDDRTHALFGNDRADWTTFPLLAEGRMVGVLGVDATDRVLSPYSALAVRKVAPIIAHALITADSVDRLRETSIRDPLTGCATRSHGLERLGIELKRAGRSGAPVALLMVDIDHFKSVNDRFGHHAGDAVLSAVGRTMLQTLRVSDVRARWGGEEFLIVLPETALEPARQVAESLLRKIAAAPIQLKDGPVRVTASIGLTLARPGEEDAEAMIGRADRALYRAKAEGRACVRIVLGDLRGAPIGAGQTVPPPPLPFRERRDPHRADRRRVPGPGRRKTDIWPDAGSEGDAIPRRAGDRAIRP